VLVISLPIGFAPLNPSYDVEPLRTMG